MSRTLLPVLAAAALLAGCAPKSDDTGTDPKASQMEAAPKVPRVMGFEAGRAVDSTGRIFGGIRTTFSPIDTIYTSIMTENVGLGAKLEVALLLDTVTVVKGELVSRAPDTSGKAVESLKIVLPKSLKLGTYKLMVSLDGKTQMGKELEITKSGEANAARQAPGTKPAVKPPASTTKKPPAKGGGGGK